MIHYLHFLIPKIAYILPFIPLIFSIYIRFASQYVTNTVIKVLAIFMSILILIISFCILFYVYSFNIAVTTKILSFIKLTKYASINITLYFDKISTLLMFAILTTNVVITISSVCLDRKIDYFRIYSYMNIAIFLMIILVNSNDFLQFFFCFEGIDIVLFLFTNYYFYIKSTQHFSAKILTINKIANICILIICLIAFNFAGSFNILDIVSICKNNQKITNVIVVLIVIFITIKTNYTIICTWFNNKQKITMSGLAMVYLIIIPASSIFLLKNIPMILLLQVKIGVFISLAIVFVFIKGILAISKSNKRQIFDFISVSYLSFVIILCEIGFKKIALEFILTQYVFMIFLFIGIYYSSRITIIIAFFGLYKIYNILNASDLSLYFAIQTIKMSIGSFIVLILFFLSVLFCGIVIYKILSICKYKNNKSNKRLILLNLFVVAFFLLVLEIISSKCLQNITQDSISFFNFGFWDKYSFVVLLFFGMSICFVINLIRSYRLKKILVFVGRVFESIIYIMFLIFFDKILSMLSATFYVFDKMFFKKNILFLSNVFYTFSRLTGSLSTGRFYHYLNIGMFAIITLLGFLIYYYH